jgi:hypothetical protein
MTKSKKPVTVATAAKRWASMPARARREAIASVLCEAELSERWEVDPRRWADKTSAEHREDALAFRAAVTLLRAAARKRV